MGRYSRALQKPLVMLCIASIVVTDLEKRVEAAEKAGNEVVIRLSEGFSIGGQLLFTETNAAEYVFSQQAMKHVVGVAGRVSWAGVVENISIDAGAAYSLTFSEKGATSTIKPYVQLSRFFDFSRGLGVAPYMRLGVTLPMGQEREKWGSEINLGFTSALEATEQLTISHGLDLHYSEQWENKTLTGNYRLGFDWHLGRDVNLTLPRLEVNSSVILPDNDPDTSVFIGGRFHVKF